MTPGYPNRGSEPGGRMRLHTGYGPDNSSGPRSEFAKETSAFVIGNNAFFIAVKRTMDAAGGFHIVGAFTMDGLSTKLRRSTNPAEQPSRWPIHPLQGVVGWVLVVLDVREERHAGERVLHEEMRPFGGFEHNAHSLRIVDLLEQRCRLRLYRCRGAGGDKTKSKSGKHGQFYHD